MKLLILLVSALLLTILAPVVALAGTHHFQSRVEGAAANEQQATDFCWILLLCLFSFLIRTRKTGRWRYHLLTAAFFLLILAAFHSHPLWSLSSRVPNPAQNVRITRIRQSEATVLNTGLHLDERVTSLAFNGNQRLWLSSGSESPILYSIATNEQDDFLAPGPVYGMYGSGGMWIFTRAGAYRYENDEYTQKVIFPSNTVPLCGQYWEGRLYIGTSQGLFVMTNGNSPALLLKGRILQLVSADLNLLAVSDDGIWRFDGKQFSRILSTPGSHGNIYAALYTDHKIYAATDSDGIFLFDRGKWIPIRFGKAGLNMISPGAAVLHRNHPFFGTMEGSIVYYNEREGWMRIKTGDSPVSALTSDGKQLYAWAGGSLICILPQDL